MTAAPVATSPFAEAVRREVATGEARLSLETSARCNLRCRMCSLEAFYTDKGLMGPATFERVLPELPGFDRLDLGTNAEALANPELERYLGEIRRVAPACQVTLVTNGVLLLPQRADRLVELGVAEVVVSIDAASEDGFSRIRGTELAPVVAHLRHLVGLRDARRAAGEPAPSVFVNCTLQDGNAGELPGVVALCVSLAVDRLFVNRVEPYFETIAREANPMRFQPAGREALVRAFVQARAAGLPIAAAADAPIVTGPCTFLFPTVSWNGDVTPCSALSYSRPYHDGEGWRKYSKTRYGNVHERSLLEIWDDPDYAAFRREVLAAREPGPCARCLRKRGVICPVDETQQYWEAVLAREGEVGQA